MKFISKTIELFFKGVSSVLCPIVYVVVFVVGFCYHFPIYFIKGFKEPASTKSDV